MSNEALQPENTTDSQLIYTKFTAVVPSYNENPLFIHVLNELLKVPYLDELIFVDDGSTDDTINSVKQFQTDPRFIYHRLEKNRGKGKALLAGVKRAKNEVVLFLDADLGNITSQKIYKIVEPVLKDEVDMSRGSFSRKRGRVTEFAVKPMMEILFPSIYFNQPISGQICAKKSFLQTAEFSDRYGVDIGLLFDAIESGQRIVEVDIGHLVNRANSAETVKEMSRQVLETMISRAGLIRHKYKLVIFTLDNTLLRLPSLSKLLIKLGIHNDIVNNHELYISEKISGDEYLKKNALLFRDIEVSKVRELTRDLQLIRYAREVARALIKRKYRIGIITSNFSPIAEAVAKQIGAHYVNSVILETKQGKFTGAISRKSQKWLKRNLTESFLSAFDTAIKSQKVKASETIFVAGNNKILPIFSRCGLSIAYRPTVPELRESADKTIQILAELLAIIE